MIRAILLTIISLILFEPPPIGCSYFAKHAPEEAYPETVGKFKRDTVLHGGMSEISAKYVNPEQSKEHTIELRLDSADNPQEAENYLNLSTAKCSAENISQLVTAKLLKNGKLKRKNGETVGVIRICQNVEQNSDNFYVEMTNGNIVFFIRTNNLYGETEKSESLNLNELIEFTKNIPFNLNIDFDSVIN